MRRILVCSIAAIAALSVAPARAGVTTSGTVYQNYFAFGSQSHPGGIRYIQLGLFAAVEVGTSGAVVTPGTRFTAYASVQECDLVYNCTFTGYPQQIVAPLAFNMDAAGNSGTFRAALTPSSGPPRQFDVTMTRPSTLSPGCNFGLLPCIGVSPWFDPTTSTAGGRASVYDVVIRDQYVTAGTFGGVVATLLPGPSISGYSFVVSEQADASAP